MERFPLLWEQRPVGELTIERQPQQTRFAVRCGLPAESLWCAWAVGDCGELRLGVLQKQNGSAALSKVFSKRMTEPLGQILRGEIRPAGQEWDETVWKPIKEAAPFRTSWLQKQLHICEEALWSPAGNGRLVAVPYRGDRPFPMMPMFCFARLRSISGRPYLVVALDDREWPYI